jgi:hypothetical protein
VTPAERAALIERAKCLAVPAVSCVRAGIRMDHLFAGVPEEEVPGLPIPGRLRLLNSEYQRNSKQAGQRRREAAAEGRAEAA